MCHHFRINCFWFSPAQNANANWRVRVVKPHGEKGVLAVVNHRELAGFSRAILFLDAVREQPRMPGAQNGLGRGLYAQPQTRQPRIG